MQVMSEVQARFGVARVPFLMLTLSCMALGVALAWPSMGSANGWRVLWVVLAALGAHVSVNALNEYHDFRTGLDLQTSRTPFSGGSGALPSHPHLAVFAWRVGVFGLLLTLGLGLHLLWSAGPARGPLFLLGAAGAALVLSYTPWLTRHPWLCAVAPGVAFGPIFLWGTCLALVQHVPQAAWWASLLPFGLTNNLLLLNQVPDLDADRKVGRLTLPMHIGLPATVRVMIFQWCLAFGAVLAGVFLKVLPAGALLVCVFIPLVVWLAWRLHRWAQQPQNPLMPDAHCVPPGMALNVIVAVLAPLLLALGVWLSPLVR